MFDGETMVNRLETIRQVRQQRQHLEDRLEELYGILTSNSRSPRDWLLELLSSENGKAARLVASALGLPIPSGHAFSGPEFASDSPYSGVAWRITTRRAYYFIRTFSQIIGSHFAPPRLARFRDRLRYLTRRLEHFSDAPSVTPDLICSWSDKATRYRFYEVAIDPELFSNLMLVCLVRGAFSGHDGTQALADSKKMFAPLKELIDEVLAQVSRGIRGDNIAIDIPNIWWALELCYWWKGVLRCLGSSVDAAWTDEADEKLRQALQAAVLALWPKSADDPPVFQVIQTKTHRIDITPEIFDSRRTAIFVGINAMRLLQNPAFDSSVCVTGDMQAKDCLELVITRALDEVLHMPDDDHIWFMHHRLAFLYEWIQYNQFDRAVSFCRNVIAKNKDDGTPYRPNTIGKRAYCDILADEVQEKIVKPLKQRLSLARDNGTLDAM